MVLLPEPEAPMIAMYSPGWISTVTPRRACTVTVVTGPRRPIRPPPPPLAWPITYVFVTSTKLTMGRPVEEPLFELKSTISYLLLRGRGHRRHRRLEGHRHCHRRRPSH